MNTSVSGCSRRHALRAAGASLALPSLAAFGSEEASSSDDDRTRMVAINVDLGFLPEAFFPTDSGRDYTLSKYLQPLGRHRKSFTVISGLSHPEVDGGHQADVSFLTGAPHPRSAGFRNSISLDQYAAQHIGHRTRFPTLNLRVGPGAGSMSYTADGVRIPSEMVPSRVYAQLFLEGSIREKAAHVRRLREGQSLMDAFGDQINQLQRNVGAGDRQRLDQYLSAVRDVEQRLVAGQQWSRRPKPSVDYEMPKDDLDPTQLVQRTRTMYDLTKLALQTDSTRLVTILVTQQFNPKVDLPGVDVPHHALTHQSNQKKSREQLEAIELAQMQELARLLDGLADVDDGQASLLDNTMVMQGSNLGHAGRHDNQNLPILLAGGGWRHDQHLAFEKDKNRPLCELYVSMLQRLGVETGEFSSGKMTLPGLV